MNVRVSSQSSLSERAADVLGGDRNLSTASIHSAGERLHAVRALAECTGIEDVGGMTFPEAAAAITARIDDWWRLSNTTPAAECSHEEQLIHLRERLDVLTKLAGVRTVLDGSELTKRGRFDQKINERMFRYEHRGSSSGALVSEYVCGRLGPYGAEFIDQLEELGVRADCPVPHISRVVFRTNSRGLHPEMQRQLYRTPFLAPPLDGGIVALEAYCMARQAEIPLHSVEIETQAGTLRGQRIYATAILKGLGQGTAHILAAMTSGGITVETAQQPRRYGEFVIAHDGTLGANSSHDWPIGSWAFGPWGG